MNYIKTQRSEAPNCDWPEKFNIIKHSLIVVYLLVAVLAFANLVGTNALATQGVVLDEILNETNKVSKENRIMTVEIEKVSNLSYIESAAIRLGFKRIHKSLIVSPVEAVASAIQR